METQIPRKHLSKYGFLRLIVMEYFCSQESPRTISDLAWWLVVHYGFDFEYRRVEKLRRVVSSLVKEGFLQKIGRGRSTRYFIAEVAGARCEEVEKEVEKIRHERLEKMMAEMKALFNGFISLLREIENVTKTMTEPSSVQSGE